MDNKALFYRSRYQTAEQYARNGERGRCLEILWELRLDPEVGHYRRALVSLLIACTTDIRQYPDKSKYAQECLDSLAELRKGGLKGDEGVITRIETHATQTLKDIGKEAEEVAVRRQAKAEGIPLDVALSKLREKWEREESVVEETPSGNGSVQEQDATMEDAEGSKHTT